MKIPKVTMPMPHAGYIANLPCQCDGTGTCHPCRIRAAVDQLEKVWLDDTKRAQAVHGLVRAIKEAAKP